MRKLRPFGKDSLSYEHGYDLSLLVSHIEGLISGEEDTCNFRGPKGKRLRKVEDALELLQEAMEMGREDE